LLKKSEEASVALYSFGDAAPLQSVTNEVLALLANWNFLGDDRVIPQIGSGIGRFEAPLPGQSTAQLKKTFRSYSANSSCCIALDAPSAASPEHSPIQSPNNSTSMLNSAKP
jgi:hypothetical protein